jgi:hypothetical protein
MLACWHVARFEFQFLSDSKHFEQTNHLPAPRQSHNQKGISNNEQGMSNVEGKRAYKLHHSIFLVRYSKMFSREITNMKSWGKNFHLKTLYIKLF